MSGCRVIRSRRRLGELCAADREFIRPAFGDTTLAKLTQLGPRPFEQLYADLRKCRKRCHGGTFTEHRTSRPHECDKRCRPHECKPPAASSVRQCHTVLSSALSAAVRWGWIAVNPADAAKRPRLPAPQPNPPSAEEAAKIVTAAWEQDDDWGTFVWATLTTGARRGELLALRWEDVDLVAAVLTIRRSLIYHAGRTVIKNTKTHQMRRISLDTATVEILTDHKERCADRRAEIGQRREHHVVHLGRVAVALVINDHDEALMLWRYRFATEQWGYELLGGIIDGEEDSAATAAREAEEESGWRPVGQPEVLVRFEPVPGMVTAENSSASRWRRVPTTHAFGKWRRRAGPAAQQALRDPRHGVPDLPPGHPLIIEHGCRAGYDSCRRPLELFGDGDRLPGIDDHQLFLLESRL